MTTTWRRMLSICTTMAGAAALTGNANAQATCGSSSGPDVIVGAIQSVSNYATSGSFDALSLGTTSCNLGNVWLNWFQNTNQHPVIGGVLYRYKDDPAGYSRFEMVGRSWLKHGFFALSQTLCCSCTGTDGTHLGVGCSDPYTSGRNGGQNNLGPRWQVNANTGAFTYPPAQGTGSTGTTWRRLEVNTADLENTGTTTTRYFGECQYVTPDDAAAGNQNNNASWRPVGYNGSNFSVTGVTTQQQAAVNAWKTIDAAVTLVTQEVPSEGLYTLGYRTTNLGGGQWHYEYLLYNMNSDLSGQSFSVPIAAGVTLSNIGFHDLDYRHGDGPGNVNYSGNDWVATQAGGSITWATDTFASNPNANALRWGTTYNFRFDANVGPVSGNITAGLFKNPAAGPVSFQGDVPGPVGVGAVFCAVDSPGITICPCGAPDTVPVPSGAPGHGCANTFDLNGAELSTTGTTVPDTIQFSCQVGAGYAGFGFIVKGDASNPAGVASSDGVLCVSGSLVRFGGHNAGQNGEPAGQWDYPNAIQTMPVGLATLQGPGTAYYQLFYRNAVAGFCTPATANFSNGRILTW